MRHAAQAALLLVLVLPPPSQAPKDTRFADLQPAMSDPLDRPVGSAWSRPPLGAPNCSGASRRSCCARDSPRRADLRCAQDEKAKKEALEKKRRASGKDDPRPRRIASELLVGSALRATFFEDESWGAGERLGTYVWRASSWEAQLTVDRGGPTAQARSSEGRAEFGRLWPRLGFGRVSGATGTT